MEGRPVRMRYLLVILTLLVPWQAVRAGEPLEGEDYSAFLHAWRFGPHELDTLGRRLRNAPDPWTRQLGLVLLPAAAYRGSNDARTLHLADSVAPFIDSAHYALRLWTHRLRALAYKRVRALDRAESEIAQAVALAERLDHPVTRAGTLIVQVEVLRALGRADLAMERLQQAETLLDDTQVNPVHSDLYINRGNLYFEQDRFDQAWVMYHRALDAAIRTGDHLAASDVASNMGAVAYMTKRFDLAIALYDSLARLPELDPFTRGMVIAESAMALDQLGRYQEALQQYDHALALQRGMNDRFGLVHTLQAKSYCLWHVGRRSEAVAHCEEALAQARQLTDDRLIADLLRTLAGWYDHLGHPSRALAMWKEYQVRHDSVQASFFGERIAQLEVRYDTERKERALQEREAQLEQEVVVRRHRTTERNILMVCTALLIITAAVLYRNVRQRRRLAEQERQIYEDRIKDQMQRSEVRALNALIEGQEKERGRIARDLHDRLGSMLSAIKIQFGALDEHAAPGPYAKVLMLLEEAVAEVRRISHDMMQGTLARFGLEAALHDLRESVAVKGRMEVDLHLEGLKERMDRSVEITAYRVVQELVTNALKHARPTTLRIALVRTDDVLHIKVVDNGIGFDPAGAPGRMGMGLSNVRERVQALGGTVRIGPGPERGTMVQVDVPLVPAHHPDATIGAGSRGGGALVG